MIVGPFPFFSPLFFLLSTLVPAAIFVVLLLVVVYLVRPAGPDPRGRRPLAIYLFAVMFVLVLVLIGGVAALGAAAGTAVAGGGIECETEFSQPRITLTAVPFPDDPELPPEEFPPPPRADVRPIRPSPVQRCFPASRSDAGAALAIQGVVLIAAAGTALFVHADEARRILAKEASDE